MLGIENLVTENEQEVNQATSHITKQEAGGQQKSSTQHTATGSSSTRSTTTTGVTSTGVPVEGLDPRTALSYKDEQEYYTASSWFDHLKKHVQYCWGSEYMIHDVSNTEETKNEVGNENFTHFCRLLAKLALQFEEESKTKIFVQDILEKIEMWAFGWADGLYRSLVEDVLMWVEYPGPLLLLEEKEEEEEKNSAEKKANNNVILDDTVMRALVLPRDGSRDGSSSYKIPRLQKGKELLITSYQKYSIHIHPHDEDNTDKSKDFMFIRPYAASASIKWRSLVQYFFRQGYLRDKTVLDIGSNAGFFSLTAWMNGGAKLVTMYEPDVRFHEIYAEILKVFAFPLPGSDDENSPSNGSDNDNLNGKKKKIKQVFSPIQVFNFNNTHGDIWDLWSHSAHAAGRFVTAKDREGLSPQEGLSASPHLTTPQLHQHEVVIALAALHWTFACTGYHKTLKSMVGLYASFTTWGLLIEWVEPDDPNFSGVYNIPLDMYEEYTEDNFKRALKRNFKNVEILTLDGQYRRDRRFYWSTEKL